MIAVDDVQWLDPASLGVLRHAVRRLDDERVRLLVAARAAPGSALPDLGLSEAERAKKEIVIGPLGLEEMSELLARELGRHLPRPALRRIAELSGGNPFYALELCRSTDRGSLDQLSGLADGEDVQRLVGAPLPPLPAGHPGCSRNRRRPRPADRRSGRRRALGRGRPGPRLSGRGARAGRCSFLRFAHPLLAAAAHAALPPRRRRDAHARLAAVVDKSRGTRSPSCRRHVDTQGSGLRPPSTQEPSAADHRGAPIAAAELLERAAALTPDDDRAAVARRQHQ